MSESFPMTAGEAAAESEAWIDEVARARASTAHLRVAVLALSACLLVLAGLTAWAFLEGRKTETVLVRIDGSGRAEAVLPGAGGYRPRAAELKHFLARFVVLHYSRLRASAPEDFSKSLMFLDRRLARAARAAAEESGEIERHMIGAEPEVDVRILSVRIPDMRSEPYRAAVDFEKVRGGRDGEPVEKERWTASFVFTVDPARANHEEIEVNPLGLTVSYFREDRAFGEEGR